MAQRRILLPWDSQPQEVVDPNYALGVDTLLHPVDGRLINLAGNAWVHENPGVPGPGLNAQGITAAWNSVPVSSVAVYRDNPGNGPRTVCLAYTPNATNSGIWSIASTATSGSPFVLLTKNGSNLRLWLGGGYRITFSGVLTPGVPLYIVMSFTSLAASAAVTATLSVNGVTQSYTGTHSTAAKTYEFLSGYGAYQTGEFACVWELPVAAPNPSEFSTQSGFWSAFAPKTIWVPFSAGGGGTPTLVAPDIAHAHTLDAVALTSSTALAAQDASHAQALDGVALSVGITLAVDDIAHGQTLDNATLSTTGATSLTAADLAHTQALDAAALTTDSTLAAADVAHAQALDAATLTLGGASLVAADVAHLQSLDAIALTMDSSLAVADVLHGHALDGVTLTPVGTDATIISLGGRRKRRSYRTYADMPHWTPPTADGQMSDGEPVAPAKAEPTRKSALSLGLEYKPDALPAQEDAPAAAPEVAHLPAAAEDPEPVKALGLDDILLAQDLTHDELVQAVKLLARGLQGSDGGALRLVRSHRIALRR